MHFELESIGALEAHLAVHGDLRCVAVQGLELEPLEARLLEVTADGAVFLGCHMSQGLLDHLMDEGAVIFPRLPRVPYRCYRPSLYTVDELLEGYESSDPESLWRATLDARIYLHYDRHRRRDGPLPVVEALAQRLHDHAVDDALAGLLHNGGEPLRVVGVMGGHSLSRTDDAYEAAARIGRGLARAGYLVATGGGPGAMEAANLGAWLAPMEDAALEVALGRLRRAPGYRDAGWLESALAVRRELGGEGGAGGQSLAIPTWFYGHEPTNVFSRHVAKYFSNSLREDGLLAIATYGVIYAPGSAGTIQEVFMDAAQNHYGTLKVVSPMVFLGRDYWTSEKPVYPLLESLAADRHYGRFLALEDDPEAVVRFVESRPPEPWEDGG